MKSFLNEVWSNWKQIASSIGDFQSRWLLTVFYFTIALPFGFVARVLLDPLNTRQSPVDSGWVKRPPQDEVGLSEAKQEF